MSSKKENDSYTDFSDDMEAIEKIRARRFVGTGDEFVTSKNYNTVDNATEPTESCCAAIGYMKIEVVMFLFMFSYIMRSVSSTTMIMDKACLVHLKYPEEICKNLKNYTNIKDEVEKIANNYSLGHALIYMVPGAVLSMFIGSWSDKYGRKLPMMMAFVGLILDGLGGSLCAAYFYSRIEFFFIPALFAGLSGGVIGVLTVMYSYASDTTSFNSRTLKYAIMEMMLGISVPLGQLAGGWVYKFFDYTAVFIISAVGHLFGLVWVIFVIKETKGLDNEDSWATKLRDLCSTQQVVDSFKAAVKKRPYKGKQQILSLITAMSFAVITYSSTIGVNYYYAHHQYNWDNTKFSTVSAVFAVMSVVAILICMPIFKRLNLGVAAFGLIGSTSMFLKNILIGLASTKELYFVGNLAGILGALVTLACRSRISKVVSKDDLGKVFAFLTTAESLLPIISTAVVSQIFNASLGFYPGLVYIILGILTLIPIGVFIWLARLPDFNYEEMPDTIESEEISEEAQKKELKETVKY